MENKVTEKINLKDLKLVYFISRNLLIATWGIALFAIAFDLIDCFAGITALLIAFAIYSFVLFFPKPILKIVSKLRKGEQK